MRNIHALHKKGQMRTSGNAVSIPSSLDVEVNPSNRTPVTGCDSFVSFEGRERGPAQWEGLK